MKIRKMECLVVAGWLLMAVHCFGQSKAGIGISIVKEGEDVVIKQVLPGGPAASSKLIEANDRIIAISQNDEGPVNVAGKRIAEVVQMIQGPKGSTVRLTIKRGPANDAEPRVVSIVRGNIEALRTAASAEPVSAKVGQPAPEIEGEDVDGKKFKLSDYKGKVVLLDFWGDW
ncbi:MAG: PDZ domain-containing protein [Verrucomicrobia bacterium]|nr:PDZ domain-containing protein [Verrucomicrobiota bacterium]